MADPVRVLLLELPRLLRGIFEHAVHAHAECEVVDTETPPDVVVLGLAVREDVGLVPALLARWPAAHVVTVAVDGDDVSIHELRPRSARLGHMSPGEIVETLVKTVRRRRARGSES